MSTATPISTEAGPLDLHDEYHHIKACGYDTDLRLSSYEAQKIAGHLRGISAIAAILLTETCSDAYKLGDYIRGGLTEALDSLATEAISRLETANGRAEKAQASRTPQGRG